MVDMEWRNGESFLQRRYLAEFVDPLWIRIWSSPRIRATFFSHLSKVRSCSGFGIRCPFAVLKRQGSIASLMSASGQSLAEELLRTPQSRPDDEIRSFFEQLLFGLHRYHTLVKTGYGAICPYNIGVSSFGWPFLIICPVATLESRNTPVGEKCPKQEIPFLAPEFQPETDATVAEDIFSVGRLLYDFLPDDPLDLREILLNPPTEQEKNSQELFTIAINAQRALPQHRYSTALEMARSLNPETQLAQLDISAGHQYLEEGLSMFNLKQYSQAEELWNEGVRNDWLSLPLRNNLAVCKMRQKKWAEAVENLERTEEIGGIHPRITQNLAFCHMAMRNREQAMEYSEKLSAMQPESPLTFFLQSNLALQVRDYRRALEYANQAVLSDPNNRTARWQRSRALLKLGKLVEAEREQEVLELLDYRVPFADYLHYEPSEPAWGRPRSGWFGTEPTIEKRDDDEDDDPDNLGTGVPADPVQPRTGGHATVLIEVRNRDIENTGLEMEQERRRRRQTRIER